MKKITGFRKNLHVFLILAFVLNVLAPAVYAQGVVMSLPPAGEMIFSSPAYTPLLLRGVVVKPQNPFEFQFLMDSGDSALSGESLKEEGKGLIKYFLAAITTPDEDLWVNLSPYEHDRIMPNEFGQTEMGRDMLAQDYLLKQLTATMMYPEKELGKKFWDRVYKEAYKRYRTTNIMVNTFNKVWILPDFADVYEKGGTAYILDSRLKIMLEEDYVASQQVMGNEQWARKLGIADLSEQEREDLFKSQSGPMKKALKEIIVPEIEREVNEGKNFAKLRQIYQSMILASWYKDRLKNSLLNQVYADQKKVKGIDVEDKDIKEKIYQQYLAAFKQGVYSYIKEEAHPGSGRMIPRKYFSGGASWMGIKENTRFHSFLPAEIPGSDFSMLARFDDVKSLSPATKIGGPAQKKADKAVMVSLSEIEGREDLRLNLWEQVEQLSLSVARDGGMTHAPHKFEQIEDNDLKGYSQFYFEDEQLKGFLLVDPDPGAGFLRGESISIEKLGVQAGAREKGVATRFLNRLAEKAKAEKVALIEVSVMRHNQKVIEWYKKFGFNEGHHLLEIFNKHDLLSIHLKVSPEDLLEMTNKYLDKQGTRDEAMMGKSSVNVAEGTFIDAAGHKYSLDPRFDGLPQQFKALLIREGIGVRSEPVKSWDRMFQTDAVAVLNRNRVDVRSEMRTSDQGEGSFAHAVSHEVAHIFSDKLQLLQKLARDNDSTIREIARMGWRAGSIDIEKWRSGLSTGNQHLPSGDAVAEALGMVMREMSENSSKYPQAVAFFKTHANVYLPEVPPSGIDFNPAIKAVKQKIKKDFLAGRMSAEDFVQEILASIDREKLPPVSSMFMKKADEDYRLGDLFLGDYKTGETIYDNLYMRRREEGRNLIYRVIEDETLRTKALEAIDAMMGAAYDADLVANEKRDPFQLFLTSQAAKEVHDDIKDFKRSINQGNLNYDRFLITVANAFLWQSFYTDDQEFVNEYLGDMSPAEKNLILKMIDFSNEAFLETPQSLVARMMLWKLGEAALEERLRNNDMVEFNARLPLLENVSDQIKNLPILDVAGGARSAFVMKSVGERPFLIVDNSYFVEGYLNRAKQRLNIGNNVVVHRADIKNLDEMLGVNDAKLKNLIKTQGFQHIRVGNVDEYIKGLPDEFYQRIPGMLSPQGILSVEKRAEDTDPQPTWDRLRTDLSNNSDWKIDEGETKGILGGFGEKIKYIQFEKLGKEPVSREIQRDSAMTGDLPDKMRMDFEELASEMVREGALGGQIQFVKKYFDEIATAASDYERGGWDDDHYSLNANIFKLFKNVPYGAKGSRLLVQFLEYKDITIPSKGLGFGIDLIINNIDSYVKENPRRMFEINPALYEFAALLKQAFDSESKGGKFGFQSDDVASEEKKPGGIDFNPANLNIRVRRDDQGLPLPWDSQPINNLQIEGLTPVIINIVPVTNLPLLLGQKSESSDELAYL